MIVNPEIKDGFTKIMLNCFQHWKKLDGEKINNLSEGCFSFILVGNKTDIYVLGSK